MQSKKVFFMKMADSVKELFAISLLYKLAKIFAVVVKLYIYKSDINSV